MTQNDGLVFYLLASGVSVAATSIVVEREGNSNIRNAPADALNALKAAIRIIKSLLISNLDSGERV